MTWYNTRYTAQLRHLAQLLILAVALMHGAAAAASETDLVADQPPGQVTLTLAQYQRLLQQAATQPLPAPTGYAMGQSELDIRFQQRDGHITATISALVEVETFENEWTLVALLGPGAALESAHINGTPVQLVQRAEGLFWLAEKRQRASVQLTYHVDSRHADRARISSLPIPPAAATRFSLRIPQKHIDLAVAPVANLLISTDDNGTTATGTVPASSSLMVSWRVASEHEYILSRAKYSGRLNSNAIEWKVIIDAQTLVDGEVAVPLISTASTLIALKINGEPASVYSDSGRFVV